MECTTIYWAGKKKWWIWFQCYWLCSCDYPECGKWWSCKGNNLASLHARFFLEYLTINFYYYQVRTNSLNRFCVHSERSWCIFFFKDCWNKCLVNEDIVIYIVNLLVSTYMKKKRKKSLLLLNSFGDTQTMFSNDRILLLLGHETRWRISLLHKGRTLDLSSQTYHNYVWP